MNDAAKTPSNFVPKRHFLAWDKTLQKTAICPAFVPLFLVWDKTAASLCNVTEKRLVPRGTKGWDKTRRLCLSRPTLFPWKGKGGTRQGGTNGNNGSIIRKAIA